MSEYKVKEAGSRTERELNWMGLGQGGTERSER